MKDDAIWDVLVVGGGPAGMMAAGQAAERGLRVLLIEKNNILGQKLLITGGGRCNVTNAELDTRKFLEKYKDSDKFLFSAFSQYSVVNSLEFFNSRGMDTKVEASQRVFPVSDSAQSVWNVLVENLKKHNVEILSNSPIVDLVKEDKKIVGVKTKGGALIQGKNIVLATGGTSRPETGSTGDAYKWLKDIGHTVVEPEPSLVPVALKDMWVNKLSGVSLDNVKLTTFQNNEKQETKRGKILFTHFGVSGPTILNMSKDIGEL
ncbi:MAG: aminoacetone oxidase family FAD-binding enzyme, partial [Minisyncoccia bacterium]